MIERTKTPANKRTTRIKHSCLYMRVGGAIFITIRWVSKIFLAAKFVWIANTNMCVFFFSVVLPHTKAVAAAQKEPFWLSSCYCSSSGSSSSGSSSDGGSQNKGGELRQKVATKWCTSWRSSNIRCCFAVVVVVDGCGCIDELVYDAVQQLFQDEIFPEILQPHPKFNFVFFLWNFDNIFNFVRIHTLFMSKQQPRSSHSTVVKTNILFWQFKCI